MSYHSSAGHSSALVQNHSVLFEQQQWRSTEPANSSSLPSEEQIESTTTLLRDCDMKTKLDRAAPYLFGNRSLLVDLLALCFGIGTWLGVNSIFIELPLLIRENNEGWDLPSYLSVMVQLGNIGPLAYTFVQKYSPRKLNDACTIYWVLAVGTICSLLMSFFYEKTTYVFGEQHSVALFLLTIGLSFNACTSNVLFMPYMGRFKETYLVTYYIGEGLSGLIPSAAALVQGIGTPAECRLINDTITGELTMQAYSEPPRYGTQAYFFIIFTLMICSCIGYTLLHNLESAKKEHVEASITDGNNYVYEGEETASNEERMQTLSSTHYIFLLLLISVISFFSNGVFGSIQSYSCMPYSNHAYHLTATLSSIANPLACFLAMFATTHSKRKISFLSGVAALLTTFVFVTALMSPRPPFHDTAIGPILVISGWTLLIGVISYTKLAITTIMRAQGGQALVWVGCLTQLGAFTGSVLIFAAINWLKIFETAETTTC